MKRFIITFLSIALFSTVLAAPFSVSAQSFNFVAGDLIKEPTNNTVYYYGYDGNRHAFPNAQTYFSWYKDFSRVKTISKIDLSKLSLGKNIVIRPGTNLLKFENSPKIYAVESLGRLRHIINPSLARTLYGKAWENKIITLPELFFSDYSDAGLLAKKEHTTGTIIRYNGENQYFLITNGYARQLSSIAQWKNYRFKEQYVVKMDKAVLEYKKGHAIDYYKVSLADTAQTLVKEEENDYLYYIKIDSGTQQIRSTPTGEQGLTGHYFNSMNLNNAYTTRIDNQIDFSWGYNSPMSQLPNNNFSVRWTGKIKIPETKKITFFTSSDDGIRLYIDNKIVINNWTDHRLSEDQGSIYLTSGFHDIRLEYYENTNDATVQLSWNKAGEVIPAQYLYSK